MAVARPGQMTLDSHGRRMRRLAVLGVVAMLVGCETATPTFAPTGPATSAPSESTSSLPPASLAPGSTDDLAEPFEIPAISLPPPTLVEPFAIGEALYNPSQVADAVVSLLAILDIPIYSIDMTLIQEGDVRPGTPWLREDEVAGIIAWGIEDLSSGDAESLPYTLADLHTSIGTLVPDLSAAEFEAAYIEAYTVHPDAIVPQVLLGQPVVLDTPLTRPQLWLLYMDAIVEARPVSGVPAPAPGTQFAQAGGTGLGVANPFLPALPLPPGLTPAEWSQMQWHLLTAATLIRPWVSPTAFHEGHGGPGRSRDIVGRIDPVDDFVAPDGTIIFESTGRPGGGLAWTWSTADEAVLSKHGTLNSSLNATVTTDANGTVSVGYTPQRELADGRGVQAVESITVRGSVDAAEAMRQAFRFHSGVGIWLGQFSIWAHELVGEGAVAIAWHTEGIYINLTNEYSVQIGVQQGGMIASAGRQGTDTAEGTLTKRDDGTYRGIVDARAMPIAHMEFATPLAGDRCDDDATEAGRPLVSQWLDVVGTVVDYPVDPNFDFVQSGAFGRKGLSLQFYPRNAPSGVAGCSGMQPYQGPGADGRPIHAAYGPFNDSRWNNPGAPGSPSALNLTIHLPADDELTYSDTRLTGTHGEVGIDSTWIIQVRQEPPP